MTHWKHPDLGPIALLPGNLQPKKVWKHFYNPREHWERLCNMDVAAMRSETEAALGERRTDKNRHEVPRVDSKRWRVVKRLLQRHHDEAYADSYAAEMADDATIWTRSQDKKQRHKALTPNSVFIVIQLEGDRPAWVVSAYRPLPSQSNVKFTEAEIRREARDYFFRDTGMHVNDLVKSTAQNLRDASAVSPDGVKDLWWLASAIGYARLLDEHDEIRVALAGAEEVLDSVDQALIDEFRAGLDWDGNLEEIATGLKDSRSEDLEHALIASEKLLAAATGVGATDEANAFLREAAELLAWLPAEWDHLVSEAHARASAFGAADHPVCRLWEAVEEAGLGAAVRETTPATRPEAKYVDELIPREPIWATISDRISAAASKAIDKVSDWLESSLGTLEVASAAPTMGDSVEPDEGWEVLGHPASDSMYFRLFIFEEGREAPQEATNPFKDPEHPVWLMDQPVVLVLFASESPLPENEFDALVDYASERSDVAVAMKTLSPPT